jgi:hypothetical protein
MNIEDLIISLSMSRIPLNSWDEKLVYSFYDQIARGNGFTEKQSSLALKILNRHVVALGSFLQKDVSPFITTPVFRIPIRQISNKKTISVVNHPTFGKALQAVFPYNEEVVNQIRKSKDDLGHAMWDKDKKSWIFSLTENNVLFLKDLAEKENFEMDEEFQSYCKQVAEIIENIHKYVPMLVVENMTPKIVNSDKNLPIFESKDLLNSIFEARKRGICTWDNTISNFIDSDELDDVTRNFLKTDPGENFHVDSEKTEISALETIVKKLSPCLVVIPGGSEYDTTVQSHTFFKEMGVEDDEMSVMFRLPTDTHEIFNKFVKNNNLNNPITEKTKVVFVSSKLPKPVLKSKIKFHCVLNMGFSNVHYSMKDFVGKHENLVFFSKKKDQRNINFAFL